MATWCRATSREMIWSFRVNFCSVAMRSSSMRTYAQHTSAYAMRSSSMRT